MSKKSEVTFRINKISKKKYYENSYEHLKGKKVTDIKFNVSVSNNAYPEEGLIDISIEIHFKENDNSLLGLETSTEFFIENFNEIVQVKDGSTNIPDKLGRVLVDLAVSNTRGMLAGLNNKPEYSNLIVPLIDVNRFFTGNKKK